MRLGPHGLCGLVMGFHTHKKVYFGVDFMKGLLTHSLDLHRDQVIVILRSLCGDMVKEDI
jgi:hypothetical protein